ncbi:MAG: hypothetical protein R2827_03035 [Bdellovibrionales bacterium]
MNSMGSEKVQEIIQSTVISMSAGMQHYAKQTQKKGLKIKTRRELNRYCFFVAGVVGELLTKLAAIGRPEMKTDKEMMVELNHLTFCRK